jgi:hypothetical protein
VHPVRTEANTKPSQMRPETVPGRVPIATP